MTRQQFLGIASPTLYPTASLLLQDQ